MSKKYQWIAGMLALCLVSAAAATFLTVFVLWRGLIDFSWLRPVSGTTTAESSVSSTTLEPAPTPKPTPTPTPKPTPSPMPTPTPTSMPTPWPTLTPAPTPNPSEQKAAELLYWWQTHDLVEKVFTSVSPSVVGIEIEVAASGTATRKTNEGSGIIFSKTGAIVTNASILSIAVDKQGKVLANAQIRVYVLNVAQPFIASLVARDPLTGLAVLTIDPGIYILNPAVLAREPELKVGQLILSMGYPDPLFESGGLSSGIITGLNRSVMLEDGTIMQMIQTDARISQACSGGPLLNLAGEVVGLSNCALTRDVVDTMSYALPAETVRLVASNLIINGFIPGRSWLGVSVLLEESFLDLQKLYKFPDGLYVSSVIKDSPAYSADLRKGDVITKINSEATGTSLNLSRFLQSQSIGSLVTFDIYRRSDGLTHKLKVYLQEYKP